jgi:nitrite reductase/ring-hydroxylating ferredoxin subunit
MPDRPPGPVDAGSVARRTVLQVIGGSGAVAVGSAGLAACSSGSATPPAEPGGSASPVKVPTSQVPVGGGVLVNSGAGVVVVQPTSGTFKAYSAVCPHQGCAVNSFTPTVMVCPCHGSTFSVTDGAVLSGPSPAGLTPLKAVVQGSDVVVS